MLEIIVDIYQNMKEHCVLGSALQFQKCKLNKVGGRRSKERNKYFKWIENIHEKICTFY